MQTSIEAILTPGSSFLLVQTSGGSSDGSRIWVPAVHSRPELRSWSQHQPQPNHACYRHLGSEPTGASAFVSAS